MPMPREPWIKLKIGIRRSGKLAALPNDSARYGWVIVLVEAKTQRTMGTFDGRPHFLEVMGRHGRWLDEYIGAGLIEVAPALCIECHRRNRNAKRGQLIVHDYLKEQRDATNADRQAAFRDRHRDESDEDDLSSDEPEGNDARNREDNEDRNGSVTSDSRARGTTVTVTETGTRDSTTSDEARANGVGPTLSKIELEAWRAFGPEWDQVRAAWIARGLRLPPSGAPDDPAGQRAILFEILDARPTDLVRWISSARGKTSHDVVAWVLAQWREIRAEAGLDDDPGQAGGPSRGEAAESLSEIFGRMGTA